MDCLVFYFQWHEVSSLLFPGSVFGFSVSLGCLGFVAHTVRFLRNLGVQGMMLQSWGKIGVLEQGLLCLQSFVPGIESSEPLGHS